MAGENTTVPTSVDAEYGIASTLSGYTIESVTITEEPQREIVPDQKNRRAKEIRYDTLYNLRLTLRGSSKPASTTITYDSQTYIVDSVEDAGTYNGLRRFNVAAHRSSLCNAETALA